MSEDFSPKVIALIPARNEEKAIKKTIESLKAQTISLDGVMVVANNCTDKTAEESLKMGVEVVVLPDNPYMKAGALNYGLEKIIPKLQDEDCILIMDADTTLSSTLVGKCLLCLRQNPMAGAVSSIFTARPCKSILEMMQAMEFWRYRRQISRNGYRAFVLTGTASIFRVGALKAVKAARLNQTLPNASDSYYDTEGRTEDNEITLALLALGYDCLATEAFSETDVMKTVEKIVKQRERWYNGALINLKSYGCTLPWYLKWVYWKQQIGLGLSMIFTAVMVTMLILTAYLGVLEINRLWITMLLIFGLERTATVWQLGWKARLIAIFIIPEQVYSLLLTIIFSISLFNFCTGKKGSWHAT